MSLAMVTGQVLVAGEPVGDIDLDVLVCDVCGARATVQDPLGWWSLTHHGDQPTSRDFCSQAHFASYVASVLAEGSASEESDAHLRALVGGLAR